MRRKLTAALIGLFVLTGASTFLSACNTVEGAGKDVASVGHAVSDEAKKDKK
jgi:predicted small secreted protein